MADYRWFNARLQPCYVMHENKIPCVMWFEDAIRQYEVPTVGFDEYILVPNIDEAAKVLTQNGWTSVAPDQGYLEEGMAGKARRCVLPPKDDSSVWDNLDPLAPPPKEPPGPAKTILLPATDWNFTLPAHSEQIFDGSRIPFNPTLPRLVDGLIDSLLDTPTSNIVLRLHLGCQVGYLYDYTTALKERSFAEKLKYDHRQYHYDILAGMSAGTIMFIAHQRVIRDALRRGEYQLRECSASRDNEDLFRERVRARLREQQLAIAAMRNK